MSRLDGKVALVTGAAHGIGAAIARRFAEEGAHLLLTDADEAAVREVAAGIGDRASAQAHDVTDEAAWDAVAAWAHETHDGINVLVNNAGIFLAAPAVYPASDESAFVTGSEIVIDGGVSA